MLRSRRFKASQFTEPMGERTVVSETKKRSKGFKI